MKNVLGKNENLKLYNKEGILIYDYQIEIDGCTHKRTYDERGNVLTYEDSYGYFCWYTYDENNDKLTFNDSDGRKRVFDIPELTMEQLVKKVGNFKLIK